MRVLAINQFYAPDSAATSLLLTQLCEDLVAAGDSVTVVASRGNYLGGASLPARETINGVDVRRPWATSLGKGTVMHRMSDYLTFWGSSLAEVAIAARPDVILALTTPPMIAAGAALVARLRGVPLVSWVQDVYPEVAVAFGVISEHHPATLALKRIAHLTHRGSQRSVALSQTMARRLEAQGQEPSRISVIQNWSNGDRIRPIAHVDSDFRRSHGFSEKFLVMYSGNLGVGHDFETFIEAARLLASNERIQFAFVGEGARKKQAQTLASGLSNVQFFPYQPLETLGDSFGAADLHLASLRPGLQGLLVPSKLYGILAAGRPLFFVGPQDSELSRVIAEQRIGWSGRCGDSPGLAQALSSACADAECVSKWGSQARRAFDENFARPQAVAKWRSLLATVAKMGVRR